jgi:RNA polymerase sigma-70 factor, ECF subfamily
MASYQAGDALAARALIDRASPPLYRFLAARTAVKAEADDLLQETWLRIHKVRHTYQPGEPPMPWLFAIARRTRIDHYRRSQRRARHEEPMHPGVSESVTATPEHDARGGLDELLAPLSPEEREILELLKIAGLSLEEVARVTATTIGAVKQKVHRAYKKLREASNRTEVSPGDALL